MWRLLFLISILPIIAALVARWWFGIRVLAAEGKRPCHPDRIRWENTVGENAIIEVNELPAMELGKQLRLAALADWKKRDPKAAAARESSRLFNIAVPPLTLIIAIFAVLVAKIPLIGAAAILLASTALSAIMAFLTLGSELRAIAFTIHKLRETRAFIRRDDEDAVAASAIAHAWSESLPPILRFF